jgi:hypothetical protein
LTGTKTISEKGFTTWTCSHEPAHEIINNEVAAVGYDYVASVTEPTCTEDGYTTWVCSHDASHTYVDSETTKLGHNWGEWQERTAATCESDGVEFRICSRCEEEETQPITAKGHDYKPNVTPPTCTEDGFTTWVCSNDATHTYIDSTTLALNHDYVPVVTKPTYLADGYTTWTCSHDSSHSYVDSITPKLGVPLNETLKLDYKQSTDAFSKNDTLEIRWHSTKEDVLKIDDNGNIQYVRNGRGTTKIQAIVDDKVIAETEVTVKYTFWQWLLVIFLFGWAWY